MEVILQTPSQPPVQRCESCGTALKRFSKFRTENIPSGWGGRKKIQRLCLGCAQVKDESARLMECVIY